MNSYYRLTELVNTIKRIQKRNCHPLSALTVPSSFNYNKESKRLAQIFVWLWTR